MGTLFSAQAWKELTKSCHDLQAVKVFAMFNGSDLPVETELGLVWRMGPFSEGPF